MQQWLILEVIFITLILIMNTNCKLFKKYNLNLNPFPKQIINFLKRYDAACDPNNSHDDDELEKVDKTAIQIKYGFPVANKVTKLKYENKRGTDIDVGYLFDYLDDILKDDIVDTFIEMWKEASSIDSKDLDAVPIQDDYETTKILMKIMEWKGEELPSNQSVPIFKKNDLIKKMSLICENFKYNVYLNSLDMKKFYYILNKWNYKQFDVKKMLDKFDMDGDGRLNLKEFLLFTIINYKFSDNSQDCKGCYHRIFESKIDPMFEFFDCGSTSYIEPEEICKGLEYLNRKNSDSYDMFACKFKERYTHTTACNSFVLKNNKYVNGKLTLTEFRRGILLGYWDRHVLVDEIKILNFKISKIQERWNGNGRIDRSCEAISYNLSAGQALEEISDSYDGHLIFSHD